MRLVHKIWLDSGGKAFGEGPYLLLARVAATGSLRQAASELDMSYNKAWHLVRTMEERLGFPLLERHVGGSSGGGSALTARAEELIARYEALRRDAATVMETLFEKHFGDFPGVEWDFAVRSPDLKVGEGES